MITVHEVFTPNDIPTHTYVDRSHLRLEEKLTDNLAVSNLIVSLSGPSKSGKTVLARKVISPDLLIYVSGAGVKGPNDLWEQVLQWMGTPIAVATSVTTTTGVQATAKVGAELAIPIIAKGKAEGELGGSASRGASTTETARVGGLQQVIKEISGSDYVVFIDDFHYIPRELQVDLGRQIKAVAENGVRICTASVPHRSDDVVRSNPELSGRVASLRIEYWTPQDLEIIGKKGFPALGVDLSPKVIEQLAAEAFGTPQLMQALCLNLCLELGVRKTRELTRFEVASDVLQSALERTSDLADYSSVVQGLHSGPKERGTERKQFTLIDGSKGDVYRCILLALSQSPPRVTFTYDEIMQRVRNVCIGEYPVGSSVSQALPQMQKLSGTLSPTVPIIEWNENVLDIVEPYFLFFLRCSRKLERLAK